MILHLLARLFLSLFWRRSGSLSVVCFPTFFKISSVTEDSDDDEDEEMKAEHHVREN